MQDALNMRTASPLLHHEITQRIIGVFYDVHHELGGGYLEKVHHRAMVIALRQAGVKVTEHVRLLVWFRGQVIGEFIADLIVEGIVLVEIKSSTAIEGRHEAQTLNYLRATTLEVGLLLNFGATPQFKRFVYTNDRKPDVAASGAVPADTDTENTDDA